MSSESFPGNAAGLSIQNLVVQWSEQPSDLQLSEHTLLSQERGEGWLKTYGEPVEAILTLVPTHLPEVGLVEIAAARPDEKLAVWNHSRLALLETARDMGFRSLEVIDRGAMLPGDEGVVIRSVVRMCAGPNLRSRGHTGIEVATPADNAQISELIRAAFTGHPENGGWDLPELEARMEQPWFDQDGVFVTRREGNLSGLCWTKVHPDGVGEIYLLAVAVEAVGTGQGRSLVEHGIDYLVNQRGCRDVIVYHEGDNTAARRLYEGLGFVEERVDRRLGISV